MHLLMVIRERGVWVNHIQRKGIIVSLYPWLVPVNNHHRGSENSCCVPSHSYSISYIIHEGKPVSSTIPMSSNPSPSLAISSCMIHPPCWQRDKEPKQHPRILITAHGCIHPSKPLHIHYVDRKNPCDCC